MNKSLFFQTLNALRAAHPDVTFVGFYRTPKSAACIKLDARQGEETLTAIVTETTSPDTGSNLSEGAWEANLIAPAHLDGTPGQVALKLACLHALALCQTTSRAYWDGRADEIRHLELLAARRGRILEALAARFGPFSPAQGFNVEVGLNIILKHGETAREFVWGGSRATQRTLIRAGLLTERAEHLLTATAQFTPEAVDIINTTE